MPDAPWGGVRDALFNGNGLARRLLIAVVVFSSLVTTFITAVDLYGEYRRDMREIDRAFNFIGSSYGPSLAHGVWQLDGEAVRTQLEGLLRLPDIEYAGIDVDGQTRWSAGRSASQRHVQATVDLKHEQEGHSRTIGTLRVVASVDSVLSRVWGRLLAALIGNAVKTALVAMFLLLAFHYLVSRHLTKVARYVGTIDPRQAEPASQALVLDRRAGGRWRPDVLDAVVAAINGLLSSVRQAHRETEASQAQLAESEMRFRLGTEAAAVGLWDCDLALERIGATEECARIVGLEPSELRPELAFWRERIHPDDIESATAELRRHLGQHTPALQIELRLQHAQLGWRWVVLRGRIVERDAQGAPARALGTVMDVTELKLAQEALLEANRQLETRVRERTLALELARDEAVRANRGKSEFLSRMSHELRTPMNAILGFAQLLEGNDLSEKNRRWLSQIRHAGDHLLSLIDELLDLARIEVGKLSVRLTPVDLDAVVQEAASMCRAGATERHITLTIEPASDVMAVTADRTRLRQILVNILSNAVKYNRDGGRIDIRSGRSTDGQHARVTISDTGLGIARERLARLFMPFERLGHEDSDIPGSGIGLALSKRLAELMHCELGAESIEGQGSSFWIDLPLAFESIGPAPPKPPDVQPAAHPVLRVLYIEDNPINLALMQAVFEDRADFDLITAQDGPSGVTMASAERPDVILLDIQLPHMDGFEVLQALRCDANLNDTPVIAVTASAMAHDVDRGKAAGFAAYVTKPFRFDELLALVEKLGAGR